jgi:hypothetical protein
MASELNEHCGPNYRKASEFLPPTGISYSFLLTALIGKRPPPINIEDLFRGRSIFELPSSLQLPTHEIIETETRAFVANYQSNVDPQIEFELAKQYLDATTISKTHLSSAEGTSIGFYVNRAPSGYERTERHFVIVESGLPEVSVMLYQKMESEPTLTWGDFCKKYQVQNIELYAAEMRRTLMKRYVQKFYPTLQVYDQMIHDQFSTSLEIQHFKNKITLNSDLVHSTRLNNVHLYFHSPVQGYTLFKLAPNFQMSSDLIPCSSGYENLDAVEDKERIDVQKYGIIHDEGKFPFALHKGVYPPYDENAVRDLSNKLNTTPMYLLPFVVWVK